MNYLDFIILIPLVYFAWKGFSHGLIIELASIIGLVAGIWAAWHFSGLVEIWLSDSMNLNSQYLNIIAFIVTMIGVIIAVHIIGKLLEKIIDLIALGFVNKLSGLAFGVFKGVLIMSLFIYIFNTFGGKTILAENTENESIIYKEIAPLAPFIIGKINTDDLNLGKRDEAEEDPATTNL